MSAWRPFLVALQFMTVLPVRVRPAASADEWRASLAFHPLAGLVVGLLVAAVAGLASALPAPLQTALALTAWVVLTGALHLDGLADTADAWLGGLGDRERTLAIMKDPRAGPMAVTCLVLCLLVKFTALLAVLGTGGWPALLLVPALARLAAVALLRTTPYVRPDGLGADLARHRPGRRETALMAAPVLATLYMTGPAGLAAVAAVTLTTLAIRRALVRRLGGTTGDTTGALIELAELAGLVVIAGGV